MKRIKINPRKNYKDKIESLSFKFHSLDNIYWDESAYYQFNGAQVDVLEKSSNELYQMCLKAVQHVIDNDLYERLCINPELIPLIVRSWVNEEPSVYGRFDLAYDGVSPPKMLEFNADTPTSLYEAAVIQWYWLQDIDKSKDQFNSIHEKLSNYWTGCVEYFNSEKIHFCCIKDSLEDFTTVEYLRDTASQAGLSTEFIFIEDVGWDYENKMFVDQHDKPIKNIFKLYPYEWLIHEEFGDKLMQDVNKCKWIEPAWKSILSNKGILPILWELFPNHPNLLPAYFDEPGDMTEYIEKPIYSREGANAAIYTGGELKCHTEGEYGEEGFVYQQLFNVPNFDGNYPIVGSWIIGGESAGIGMRESTNLITDNFSRFIPHLFY